MSDYFETHRLHRSAIVALACCAGLLIAAPVLAGEGLKDPTRPPTATELERTETQVHRSSPFELTAILIAKGRRIAVINGQPVQAGDHVSDTKVISILRDKVILRARTGDLALRLLPRPIKIREATGP